MKKEDFTRLCEVNGVELGDLPLPFCLPPNMTDEQWRGLIKNIGKSKKENKLIEVCDQCLKASCWYGEFMCDYAQTAGTKKLPRKELKKLNLESPEYWSEKKLKEIYG